MSKQSELANQLTNLTNQLSKATQEIQDEIQNLKDQLSDADISPEAQSALDSLTTKVQALDDLNPDTTTPPSSDTSGGTDQGGSVEPTNPPADS